MGNTLVFTSERLMATEQNQTARQKALSEFRRVERECDEAVKKKLMESAGRKRNTDSQESVFNKHLENGDVRSAMRAVKSSNHRAIEH